MFLEVHFYLIFEKEQTLNHVSETSTQARTSYRFG